MGWGNIITRRLKVFAIAIIIYVDYKVEHTSSPTIPLPLEKKEKQKNVFLMSIVVIFAYLFIREILCRQSKRECNGPTGAKRIQYGRKHTKEMQSVFSI